MQILNESYESPRLHLRIWEYGEMMLMNGQWRVTIPKHGEFVVKLFEEWDLVTGQLQLSDLDSTPSLH